MSESDAPSAGTMDVLERHRFDAPALARWLERRIDGFRGPITVRQFRGGQSNPTYHLRTAGGEYVLRRKPPGTLLPSAHAVDREYRVLSALAGSGVPVPRTYVLCEDPSVIGTPFYVMEFVRGHVLADPRLPDATPERRRAIYESMTEILARLHRVDWRAIGLESFGRPGNYFARQIHRWTSQYRASETEKIDAMERLIEWMPAHVPPTDETTLVHGDFRLGNMLVHPTEPRVVAVLDWELSTLGHPLADLAYNCLPFRIGEDAPEGMSDATRPAGIPSERDYLAAYCRRAGRDTIEHWEFYVAFSMFRLAAIAQGIMGRVVTGTASDPDARERGRRARPMAESAWSVVTRAQASAML